VFAVYDPNPQYGWEIAVIDYRLGVTVSTLSSEDEAAAQLETSLLPFIRRYAGDEVTFLTVYYATEAYPQYPAFTWNTETGEVTPDEVSWSLNDDTLAATGEVIRRRYDERLPAALSREEAIGDFGPKVYNVLRAYDPTAGTTHVFYNDSDEDIDYAIFIQNGERVLVRAHSTLDTALLRWVVIERDGAEVAEVAEVAMPQIVQRVYRPVHGTPDGFAYLEQNGTPALIHVNTRSGVFEPEIVWTGEAQTAPELVYVQSHATPPESYTPWANLVEPTGE
jgi:hypothetical protein